MNNPLISVIVPVYNCEQYIDKCLESIQRQTHENLEVIMVDDGSVDGSADICRSYTERDMRFKYFYKENGGASSARNFALDRAIGDYIGFVDGDDEILPDMYETLLHTVHETQADVGIIAFIMSVNGKILKYTDTANTRVFDNKSAILELHKGTIFGGHLPTKLFKRELFDGVRLPEDISICEDLIAVWELFRKSERIAFRDAHKYVYKMNTGSAFYGAFKESFLSYITATELLLERAKEHFPDCVDHARISVVTAYLDVVHKLYYSGLLDKDKYKEYKARMNAVTLSQTMKLMPLYKRVIAKSFCTSRLCYVVCIRCFDALKSVIYFFNS